MNIDRPLFVFTPQTVPSVSLSLFQKTKNAVARKVNDIFSRLAQPMTFPGASAKLKNPERLKKAEDELKELGGEPLVLNTPDGEKLEAMYFDVDNVAKALGGDQKLHVYRSYNSKAGRPFRYIEVPDENKNEILREELDWEHHRIHLTIPLKGWCASVKNFLSRAKLCSPAVENKSFFIFALGSVEFRDPKANQLDGKRPTVILCPGGGCTFQMLKKVLIPAYLKRGIHVMAVNYRGYGRSSGFPTEKGLNTDIETAYQFVSQIKNIPDEKIIAHGHCLGSVPATELAVNHPGIHLVLDRPISHYKLAIKDSFGMALDDLKNSIAEKIPSKLQGILKKTIGIAGTCLISLGAALSILIGRFDNESKIGKVRGSIAFIQSKRDETLSPQHVERLAKKVTQLSDERFSLLQCRQGHSDAWIDDSRSVIDDQFDAFLRRSNLLGSLA